MACRDAVHEQRLCHERAALEPRAGDLQGNGVGVVVGEELEPAAARLDLCAADNLPTITSGNVFRVGVCLDFVRRSGS